MNTQINVAQLSAYVTALQNCKKRNNSLWIPKWEEGIKNLLEPLPSGNGINWGVKFDLENSTPENLRFTFSYQHMNNGYHDNVTHHELIIQPSLSQGFNLEITGEADEDVLDYFYDLFHSTFYFEPDYHHKKDSAKKPLLELYGQLKNRLGQIAAGISLFKKQPVKS